MVTDATKSFTVPVLSTTTAKDFILPEWDMETPLLSRPSCPTSRGFYFCPMAGRLRVAGTVELGGLSLEDFAIMPLGVLSVVYAVGLCWSLLHHRLAGITHVEILK